MATQTFDIKLTANGKEVKQLMTELKDLADKYEKELEKINLQLKDRDKLTDAEIKKLEKQSDAYASKIKALNTAIEGNITNLRKVEDVMKNLAGSSSGELGKALRGLGSDFKRVSDQTLKNGEKMEEKLIQIKEKMMEVRHEMTKRDGIDAMKRAQTSLTELANTPLDKLKMGLESIEKKLSTMSEAELKAADGMTLLQGRSQYKAQIAVTEFGRAGTADLSKMNEEQLRAEQQRLRSLYSATSGAKGFELVSQEALNRLHAVNDTLAEIRRNADAIDLSKVDFDNLNNTPLERLDALLKQIEKDEKRLAASDKQASEQMAINKRKVQEAIQRVKNQNIDLKNAQYVAANTGKHNVQQLQAAYDTLKQHLMSLNTSEQAEIQKTKQQMKGLKDAIDQTTGSVKQQGSALKTTLKNLVAYAGVFAMFNRIKGLLTDLVKKNAELGDSLTDVRKVSGLTGEEINKLYSNIAKIDTRNSINTLTQLAYQGGKLGIQLHGGVQALTEFVRAAEQVQTALGEEMGEEALPAMAKLTENMGLIKSMGVEQAMQRTASAIFKLFTTSVSTGTGIVDFSKRLMPVAKSAHVATDELLGLASATESSGLAAEVASTAFVKIFPSLYKNTAALEQYLGMQQNELQMLLDQDKAMEGLVLVFDKMNKLGNLNKQPELFKLLGSEGARMNTVMTAMANNVDMLRGHLWVANQAFKDGTAVMNEYALQNATAAAIFERAGNIWEKSFVNPEGVDLVKQMAQEWYNVSKEMTTSETVMNKIKFTLGSLAAVIKVLITYLPELVQLMLFYGVAKVLQSIYNGYVQMRIAMDAAYVAQGRLNMVMKSNAILFAASAALTLVASLGAAAAAAKNAKNEMENFTASMKDFDEKTATAEAELKRYKKAIDEATEGSKQRTAAIANFNSKFGSYLSNLLTEKSTADDIANAYKEVNKQLRNKIALELRDKDMEKYVNPATERQAELGENYEKYVTAGKNPFSQYNRTWLRGFMDDFTSKVEREMKDAGKEVDVANIFGTEDMRKRVANELSKAMNLGLTQAQIDLQRGRVASGDTKLIRGGNRQGNAITRLSYDTRNYEYATQEERVLNMALQFIDAEQKRMDAQKKVMDKWSAVIDDSIPETGGSIDTGDTGGGGGTGGTGGGGSDKEIKEALRKDLKDAKEQSDAVISKIEEWYRLQETVITDMQADGKLTKEQAEQVVRTLNIAKNTALRDARLAISGRDTKAWEQTKQQIGDLMLDQGKWSQELLGQILGVSMENIRANLAKIDKGGGKDGITTSSLKDAVDKNAAGNQREIARLMVRAQQEVEKIFMEYDFFEQAMRGFSNRLAQMGILSETARNMAERLTDANDVNTMFSMKDYDQLLKGNEGAKQQMLQAFIASGAQPYGVNPEDKEQLRAWFMEFVGEFVNKGGVSPLGEGVQNVEYQYQSWAKPFEADFDLWLRDSDKYLASIQSFYLSLMKSEEDYYEKRKQSYNHYKKQLEQQDQAAGIPTQREDTEKRLQTESQLQDEGIGASFWRQQGLGGIMNDPEVMLIQQRIEWRNQDLESAKALLAGKEALWQQEKAQRLAAGEDEASIEADLSQRRMGFETLIKERQTALFDQQLAFTTKIAQEMQKRVQTVNNLTKPIQDGAKNIGQKFGEMIRGIEEQSMTWKETWHSMAVAVGESVIDMTAQYAQNLIMEKAMNAQSKQEAISKAQVDVAAGTASGAAKTIGTLGWWGIALVPVIAALLKGLLQAAFASNKQSDTTKAVSSNPKIKLVSNMLTYDNGTDLSPYAASSSQQKHRYIGTDGRVYTAREDAAPKTGLITRPIATTVQGQPALVAERGPEIVIGRKTTKRIQMAAPELLHAIQLIDRGYTPRRLYDKGTPLPLSAPGGFADGNTQQSDQDTQMQQTLAALTQTVAVLSATVTQLQQKGIPAHINKYGSGGLIDEVKSGLKFDARYNK